MEYFVIVVLFFLIVGAVMLAFGVKEAKEAQNENPVAKLRRIREQRGSMMAMGLDAELEAELAKKFARDEELRAVEAKKSRGKLFTALDVVTHSNRMTQRLDEQLQQINSFWRATELLVAVLVCAFIVLLVCLWAGLGWLSLVPALACVPLPWAYVKSLRARYYRKFDEQLADTLMLMSNSLRAGFSFLQALEMIAREAPFPIANEFRNVTQEIALGISISEALDNLSARIGSADLDLMVTAVNIQRETGGALAEILDVIARVIQERMTIKGEIRTLTSQGRLTGAVLGALPILLGVAIHFVSRLSAPYEPSFVEPLFSDQRGHIMVGLALAMQAVGIAWIMKIVTIKV
jgi:tight adherence protein B